MLFSGRKPAMLSELKEFEPYQIFNGLTFCTHRGQLKYFKTAMRLNIFQVYRDIASFDDFGYDVAENAVHVHDLHATILRLMGIDHERLTYRYQGRDFRLTDVHGEIVKPILA